MPGALDDLLVVDLSRVLAGPMLAMTLADLGADVVKVESPAGDDTRSWGPPFDASGRATYHHAVNRNKRSIALDLVDPEDLATARRLCERADVVVSNFRPGVLERRGLGYDDVRPANPGVVYCEISGFGGDRGRDLPGYDPLAQALGGLMSINGPPELPVKTGVALVDEIAGLYGAVSILAALRHRDRSGAGQRITLNLLHVTLACLANQATGWLCGGAVPQRMGNAHPSIEPFGTYQAADGPLMLCVGNDGQFARLAQALDIPGLVTDARFASNRSRVVHREELRPILEDTLAADIAAAWAARLSAADVPAGAVHDVPEAFAFAERLGLDVVDEHGGVSTVRFPAALSATPAATRRPPPDHDEHREEVLHWLQG